MRKYYKNDILRLARKKDSFRPIVIHFLIKNEKIIFVGQNVNPNMDFDRYFSLPCRNEEEAVELEKHYIKTLVPFLNKIQKGDDCKNMFLEVAQENEQHKPLIRTSVAITIPRNTYEKKYTNGRFIWLFNIDGVLYEGEYADSETYSLNGKIYKPRQTKGFIEA